MNPVSTRVSSNRGIASKPWWPRVKRVLSIVFFVAIAALLTKLAQTVDWNEVWNALRRRPPQTLFAAAATAAASYFLYSCFDLIGRRMTRHTLPRRQVMQVNFISYAFNLNMGALIGGVAFRYRLYSRLGLDAETITRVMAVSMLTNWLGYLAVAGSVFWLTALPLPPDWKLDTSGLQWLGMALLSVALAYIALCALSRRRQWLIKGHELTLPSLRLAMLQMVISSLNWLLIAATVFLLLEQKLSYPTVLAVLLLAAIAGVITHVPAGLGVLEAVFIALLSAQLPKSELLAALLAYRAIYYLGPLLIASVVYFITEAAAKHINNGIRDAG